MHTVTSPAVAAAATPADARRRRQRASPSPARPATPARSCCGCWRGIRRVARDGGDVVGRGRRRRGRCRRWRGSGTARSRRSSPDDARARRRPRVPGAARFGGGGARRRRCVDAGVRVIDLSGAFRLRDAAARARWYPETHRVPDGVAYGLTERERDAVAARAARRQSGLLSDRGAAGAGAARRRPACSCRAPTSSSTPSRACRAPARRRRERTHFSEVPRQPVGVRRVRPPARRRDRAGARRTGHVHAASGAARPRHSGDDLRARARRARPRTTLGDVYERAYAGATFVRLVGPALPEIKHVAHTNFCDIGWRVDPSGRVDPRVGHRQPAEGRVGAGGAEHERDARPRRDGPGCCERAPVRARRLKFGGELLEDPARLATVVVGASPRVAATRRAAGHRAWRRQGNRRGAQSGRHREAAGRRPADHRRADARRRGRGAGRRRQHAVRGGADDGRRAAPSD